MVRPGGRRGKPKEKAYYDEFKLAPNCSDKEIRTAFRKLSVECHPDKNGGDDTRFKTIKTMYEVLSDPEKRHCYDAFGADFSEVPNLEAFTQQLRPQPQVVQIQLTLKQAIQGKTIKFSFQRQVNSSAETLEHSFEFPAGGKTPQEFHFPNLGHQIPDKLPGALVVVVQQQKDKHFARSGDALVHTKKISLAEMLRGQAIIQHPNETNFTLTRSEGLTHNKWYQVEKQGVTELSPMFIRFELEMPKLNVSQRTMILKALGTTSPAVGNSGDVVKSVSAELSDEEFRARMEAITLESHMENQAEQGHHVGSSMGPQCKQQ